MTNLVEIDNLNIRFTGDRTVHAVNDLSLQLGEGEVLGLLGESGSGKSVTLPEICVRFFGSSRISARRVTLLPEPDSPSRPSTSPSPSERLRSFTA